MMEALKRTFTFRSKKSSTFLDNGSKPLQWNDDERKVREGSCSFQVKYLGSIEVFESRGMPVCEEAMRQLMKYKSTKKVKRAVLYVSGDALRVTEEISKGLMVDQVIEKVSFCAPDRNHHRGFAYICRDASTRRWLCHGFKAVKETGERLSHAVGCAFAVCLERKQLREKESVDVTYNESKTSFTRLGSFKQATIIERLQDPQSVIIPEAVPNGACVTKKAVDDQSSIPRPRASQSVFERQSSLRIFPKLQDEQKNPFKRDYSVKIADLPSNQDRWQLWSNTVSIKEENSDSKAMANVTSPSENSALPFEISRVCNSNRKPDLIETYSTKIQRLDQDPFSAAPMDARTHLRHDEHNIQMNSNKLHSPQHDLEPVRPFNQSHSIDAFNNNDDDWVGLSQNRSFHNFSTAWSQDTLRPVSRNSQRHEANDQPCVNCSPSNPFDVSWVNLTIKSNISNNGNPFMS